MQPKGAADVPCRKTKPLSPLLPTYVSKESACLPACLPQHLPEEGREEEEEECDDLYLRARVGERARIARGRATASCVGGRGRLYISSRRSESGARWPKMKSQYETLIVVSVEEEEERRRG